MATAAVVRFFISDEVPERTSWKYTAVMRDENGFVIAQADIQTLVLTIYTLDVARTIVNGVEETNIFNTGRGMVGATGGTLTIVFEPGDSAILDPTKMRETHVGLIEMTWGPGGAKSVAHEIAWTVVNLDRRT